MAWGRGKAVERLWIACARPVDRPYFVTVNDSGFTGLPAGSSSVMA